MQRPDLSCLVRVSGSTRGSPVKGPPSDEGHHRRSQPQGGGPRTSPAGEGSPGRSARAPGSVPFPLPRRPPCFAPQAWRSWRTGGGLPPPRDPLPSLEILSPQPCGQTPRLQPRGGLLSAGRGGNVGQRQLTWPGARATGRKHMRRSPGRRQGPCPVHSCCGCSDWVRLARCQKKVQHPALGPTPPPGAPDGACPPRGCPYRPCRGSAAPPRVLGPPEQPTGPRSSKYLCSQGEEYPNWGGRPWRGACCGPYRPRRAVGGSEDHVHLVRCPPSFWDFPEDILRSWKVGLVLGDLKKASAAPPQPQRGRGTGRRPAAAHRLGGHRACLGRVTGRGLGTNAHPLLSQRALRASTGRPRALAPRHPDCRDTCEENICF